ncbi:MAG: zf-HC2 domain-containing protein [Burkholderiales bacterium]
MSKLMYSCRQASELSSKAMDQPLGPMERLLLRLHLMMCKGCSNFSRQLWFLRRASRKLPEALDKDEG